VPHGAIQLIERLHYNTNHNKCKLNIKSQGNPKVKNDPLIGEVRSVVKSPCQPSKLPLSPTSSSAKKRLVGQGAGFTLPNSNYRIFNQTIFIRGQFPPILRLK
jgi:hypothetical protein